MTIALDFDGTLVTAGPKQSFLLSACARRSGIDIAPAEVWRRKREGMSNNTLLADLGVVRRTAETISAAWGRSIETPYWQSLDRPFDDARDVLAGIAEAGERCILVSARRDPYLLRQQVRQLGLARYFNAIFCVSPADAAAEKAAILLENGARLFVGDTESDREAARRSGVAFRAVATGQRSAEFLIRHGAADPSPTLGAIFGPAL